jgi:hypothetical protein
VTAADPRSVRGSKEETRAEKAPSACGYWSGRRRPRRRERRGTGRGGALLGGPVSRRVLRHLGNDLTEGTSVFLEREDTFFASGNFSLVFTADTGKSITISAAGPVKGTFGVIDEQAGTITFSTTFVGLPEKLSITNGPTLSRDAGTLTIIDVFECTGDPENPVGDFVSSDFTLHGPHPDFLSGFELFCDVVEPYLLDP